MTAIVGGLAAALLWGLSAVAAQRSARAIGSQAALAWVYVVGLAATLPVAVAAGGVAVDAAGAGWTILGAGASVASLLCMYGAVRRGPLSIVMPVIATDGAGTAVLSIAGGERPGALTLLGLAVLTVGLYGVLRPPSGAAVGRYPRVALIMAVAAAALASVGLLASARAGDAIGVAAYVSVARSVGILALGLPLALRGSWTWPWPVWPLIVFSGVADSAGFAAFIVGAGDSVAVSAVLSSQYAAVAGLVGILALGERLTRLQAAAAVTILLGVAVVAATAR